VAATLWLPDEARKKVLVCTLCGTEYSGRQRRAHEAHVVKCAKKVNEDLIAQAIDDKASSAFTSTKGPDPELWEHERSKR